MQSPPLTEFCLILLMCIKRVVASLKRRPKIVPHKTSPAKAAEPGGKFVNLEESACLNMKL